MDGEGRGCVCSRQAARPASRPQQCERGCCAQEQRQGQAEGRRVERDGGVDEPLRRMKLMGGACVWTDDVHHARALTLEPAVGRTGEDRWLS